MSKGFGKVQIPVTILTYQRPYYLDRTLKSFLKLNYDCLGMFKLLLMSQGTDPLTIEVAYSYKDYISNYIPLGSNNGCAHGYTQLMEIIKEDQFPYVMHLQDDWLSTEPLTHYMDQILWMFENHKKVGYIRLRSIHSKVNKYNGITGDRLKVRRWPRRFTWSRIIVGNYHFTFNPTIARTSIIKKMLPLTGEREAMEKYYKLGLYSAQLNANCFNHIGDERALNEDGKWVK